MKKLFSLVALVGIFALMSFSMKSNSQKRAAEFDYCNEYAIEYMQAYDLSPSETRAWYYACLRLQQ